ncbi:MAG: peptidylprolyl isomerase [Planctomycetes bacterium]|nr:peptidylprolyl isomerase [Planctomycetota bacterium]
MLARAAAHYESATSDADQPAAARAKDRLATITYSAWARGVALTKDFSKDGPASLGLATVRAFVAGLKINRASDDWRTKLPQFPEVAFSRGEEYLWTLDTNQGVIVLRFFSDTAPRHVANFLYLSEIGFFDGLLFHRVIPGFMAQGGCPKRNGSGDPGYTFASEFGPEHKHDKPGILSMANTGAPSSDGSQFFITFVPTPNLDGKHTIFGEVIDGMDVVKKLESQGTPAGPPKTELVINTARVSVR